jgi:hypothetical protein
LFGKLVSTLGCLSVLILSQISVHVFGRTLGSDFNKDFHSSSSSFMSFLNFSSNSSYFFNFSFTFSLSIFIAILGLSSSGFSVGSSSGFSSQGFSSSDGFSQQSLSYLLEL